MKGKAWSQAELLLARAASHLPENPNLNLNYEGVELHRIALAGGCFWGVQAYLDRIEGVAHSEVGYANGKPSYTSISYQEVCRGDSEFAEVVLLDFDPERLPLENLLGVYFSLIDPTSVDRQANDVGRQYRTGIYYVDEADREKVKVFLSKEIQPLYKKKVVTEVLPLSSYFSAEDYHQKYLEKNPSGYCHIRFDQLEKK